MVRKNILGANSGDPFNVPQIVFKACDDERSFVSLPLLPSFGLWTWLAVLFAIAPTYVEAHGNEEGMAIPRPSAFGVQRFGT